MTKINLPLNDTELHALNVCLNYAGNAEAWAELQADRRLAEALLRVARKIATVDLHD